MKNKLNELQTITLPAPLFSQDKTVFEALKLRKTVRAITTKEIPLQILADLLWAGNGINRVRGPLRSTGRTAASASNAQEIDIYVARPEGTYLYEAKPHKLTPVAAGDIRALALDGQRGLGAKSPVRLIYVVNLEKFKSAGYQEPGLHDPEIQKSYYYAATGFAAQNIYLAAAALGLAAWFHNCNKPELQKALGLKPHQRALFGQTIGYATNPRSG